MRRVYAARANADPFRFASLPTDRLAVITGSLVAQGRFREAAAARAELARRPDLDDEPRPRMVIFDDQQGGAA